MLANGFDHLLGRGGVGNLADQLAGGGNDVGIGRMIDDIAVTCGLDLLFGVEDAITFGDGGDLFRRAGHADDGRMEES